MRFQFFEFNDLPWLPTVLRNGVTRYLSAAYRGLPAPRKWAECIALAMDKQSTDTLIDLCSGDGGPLELVQNELLALGKTKLKVIRTDLFPMAGVIWVDARCVPKSLDGVRTMFAGFHHFAPKDARAILIDARDSAQGICIFEATRRAPVPLLMMLLTPLLALVVTLRIRPLTWSQILFTYLIPVLPLLIGFDGFVSCLRTYTVEELREMTADLATPSYEWQALDIQFPGVPFAFPTLLGRVKP